MNTAKTRHSAELNFR